MEQESERERERDGGKPGQICFHKLSYFTSLLPSKTEIGEQQLLYTIVVALHTLTHTHRDLFLRHLALFASTSAATCCEFDVGWNEALIPPEIL